MGDLQDVRRFTVQIQHAKTKKICGTGFVVCSTGKVVTCRHVVAQASEFGLADNGAEVSIYFEPAQQKYRGFVVGCFNQWDDDVVLLQLDNDSIFHMPEQMAIAKLGSPSRSRDHRFRSFGYRILEKYEGAYAFGKILGNIPRPKEERLQLEPLQIESQSIAQGMSGAAVLDSVHNQVVGIISETWNPQRGSTKDRDTAFAVDARVLSLTPMNLQLQSLPLTQSSQFKEDVSEPLLAENHTMHANLSVVPSPPENWVGRVSLLTYLNQDWSDRNQLIIGLVGFGGEGKSSLASYWLTTLAHNSLVPTPDDIFWWSFYDKPTVEVFFEALLTFLIPGINLYQLPSASVKAQVILSVLGRKRHILVLDGLEVLQYESSKSYGQLKDVELRNFLLSFAKKGEHQSLCLITSRAPLVELIDYSTYTQYDVEHLSLSEGQELLKKLGVRGSDEELSQVVREWRGYALALNLLGLLLVKQYNGDVTKIQEVVLAQPAIHPHEQISRVLRRYDQHLLESEKNFLTMLSAYRLPVPESVFTFVFEVERSTFAQLIEYRILRYNQPDNYYTLHPLIRHYYLNELATRPIEEVQKNHRKIASHYESSASKKDRPLLRDLLPWMEAVYHYCRAEDYDQAFQLYYDWIYRGERHLIVYELCAYKDALNLMLEFFSGNDLSQNPQLSDPSHQRFILNEVGFCKMNTSKLQEAEPFYQKAINLCIDLQNWHNASISSNNLAMMYTLLCEFEKAVEVVCNSLDYASRSNNHTMKLKERRNALTRRAWIAYLQGKMEEATADFEEAEHLHKQVDGKNPFLYTKSGIWYAKHLRQLGDADYARRMTEVNLEICLDRGWLDDISRCHCVLGNLAEDSQQHESALFHYDKALEQARGIGFREVLVEALLAKGLWLTQQGNPEQGEMLLKEALDYAYESEALLYVIDIRLGLAIVYLQRNNPQAVAREARRTLELIGNKQYFWGKEKAKELLSAVSNV